MTTSPSDRAAGVGRDEPQDAVGRTPVDLAVIGAGPAGLAATVAAAERGLVVALIDAEPVAGGQFWRHPGSQGEPGAITGDEVAGLHHDLADYRDLLGRLRVLTGSGWVVHRPRHDVWSVQRASGADLGGDGFWVNAVTRGRGGAVASAILARTLLLTTGAYDLQVPFPGWDLPGVMTAGGVQSLLKGHAVPAGHRIVVAGTGPFLLSVASGLARSGVTVRGVYEAARPSRWWREARSLACAGSKIVEAAGYARDLARYRIPYRTGWTVVRAEGPERLESVTVAPLGPSGAVLADRSRTVPVDVLAVGWGFVPQVDLGLGLGCRTAPDPHGLPVLRVDAAGRTSVPGVYAAGEVTGVGGAGLAVVEGELAGIAIAGGATRADRGRVGRLLRRRRSLRSFAGALHRSYPVPTSWIDGLTDDTVVCRCEEVPVGAIRSVLQRDGVSDGRSARLLARPGMGWCQGRMCGYATERLALAAGTAPSESGARDAPLPGWPLPAGPGVPIGPPPIPATERPVVSPIPLGLLAEAAEWPPPSNVAAVVPDS